jgi:uncharacterized OB-fold protein
MSAMQRPPRRRGVYEEPFWAALSERTLHLQSCTACAHIWYPPGPVCPRCLSMEWRWQPMSGRGRLVAWTVFHRQYFKELPAPHLVASAVLDEGPLIAANLVGVTASDLRVDMPVVLEFVEAQLGKDAGWIYQWRPAR